MRTALLVALWALLPFASFAECPSGYGDIDSDSDVDVADVQCLVDLALRAMVGEPPSGCAVAPLAARDLDADGDQTVLDVALAIQLALGLPLPPPVDFNANGCHDALEGACGDGICAEELGESCVNCGLDCGSCEDSCCASHETAGCAEPSAEACVCDISPFCCEFFWDESCASIAIEFCEPQCGGLECAVQSTIGCGDTMQSNTFAGPKLLADYPCGKGDPTGPERVFAFTAASTGDSSAAVAFSLDIPVELSGAMHLRVLEDACNPSACVAASGDYLLVEATSDTTYYVVIEGPAAESAPFALTATCASDCDAASLCAAEGAKCGPVSCVGQTFSCGSCTDGLVCIEGACQEVTTPGCPSAGSCFAAKSSGGCADPSCCVAICEADPFCCDSSWDITCANAANMQCEGGTGEGCGDGICGAAEDLFSCPEDCSTVGSCGDGVCDLLETLTCPSDCSGSIPNCPASGSCQSPQATPGCSDADCCGSICGLLPECCTVAWDSLCANTAAFFCL